MRAGVQAEENSRVSTGRCLVRPVELSRPMGFIHIHGGRAICLPHLQGFNLMQAMELNVLGWIGLKRC